MDIRGVNHWRCLGQNGRPQAPGRWRAVDEHGAVLDVLVHEHRKTEAATSFFDRLLREDDVPELIHTDKLWRDGATLRERGRAPQCGARPRRLDRSLSQPD